MSLHAWCKFEPKTWDVPHNEVWVWVCQICVWLHLKLAPWLNMTGKEYAEVSSHTIAENVTNEWLTAKAIFSVSVVFGHLSAVWEGWHAWSPNPCFMCCSRNMPSCKSEAVVCRYLFPLSFQCTHLDLHQKSRKLSMKFHWLYALPHIFFKTEMAGFFLLAATLQYAIQCFL